MKIPLVSYAALRARDTLTTRRRARRNRLHGHTPENAQFWATRHTDTPAIFDAYWNGRDHPARILIAQRLAALNATSYLDVGCGAGPALYQLAQHKPAAELAGIDISAAATAYARQALTAEHITADLHAGPALPLPYDDDTYDVAYTNGLLACIGPDQAAQTIRELQRVARRHVLIVEGQATRETHDITPVTTYWRRDYTQLLPGATTEPIPPEHVIGHMDTIIHWSAVPSDA